MNNKLLLIMPIFNGYENELKKVAQLKFKSVDAVFYDEKEFFSLYKLPFYVKVILYFLRLIIYGNMNENRVFIKIRDFFIRKYLSDDFNRWVLSKQSGYYDNLLIIKGFGLYAETINCITAKKKTFYQWDNLIHFPTVLEIIGCFDSVYSFDINDARRIQGEFLPNFYIPRDKIKKNNDMFFVGVYSKERYAILKKLTVFCNENNYTFFFKLYHSVMKEDQIITNKKISPKNYNQLFIRSKFILEITKDEQIGYSQRYLEALDNNCLFVVKDAKVNEEGKILSLEFFLNNSSKLIETRLKSDLSVDEKALLNLCRIDNWLEKLLE
ncbi:hypothetical protein PLEI_0617 [Photobacterium leiognathi lrivu.4.1]|uniref:Uncharacterized protein n=1 Tax=Photobacterium leiognathi lrivu.4.1 TaxID=1248232 RepID=X0P7Q8_PHOLE|nr:hypothetical protein [Photobacterium leiognathi]GAD28973.1 hypothetical protein PLEI_0617 [Photobacterium leiognathi lrivu.4.1]